MIQPTFYLAFMHSIWHSWIDKSPCSKNSWFQPKMHTNHVSFEVFKGKIDLQSAQNTNSCIVWLCKILSTKFRHEQYSSLLFPPLLYFHIPNSSSLFALARFLFLNGTQLFHFYLCQISRWSLFMFNITCSERGWKEVGWDKSFNYFSVHNMDMERSILICVFHINVKWRKGVR